MVTQAKKFGMKSKNETVFKIEKENNIFNITTDNGEHRSLAVIIASGAKYRELGIPGETEFASRGVSYCATCDGPFFKNKDIVVVGGGDTALTEALFLTKFAKTVTIIHRKERFRAVQALNSVKSVILKNIKSGETKEFSTGGVFVFIGLDPNTDFLDKSILDKENYIVTDNCLLTNIEGLYAAGDVRSGAFRQIVCAVASGATCVEYAGKYIDKLKGNEYK
jgi:thioredoxin reductase (NADPH)